MQPTFWIIQNGILFFPDTSYHQFFDKLKANPDQYDNLCALSSSQLKDDPYIFDPVYGQWVITWQGRSIFQDFFSDA